MPQHSLPGAELIERGHADLLQGSITIESLLVSIAAPRLRAIGFILPVVHPDAELMLYRMLAEEYGDGAHSRFNALVRRVVSYTRSAKYAEHFPRSNA